MRKVVVIEFDAPTGCNKAEQEQFIKDALGHWGGQFHPDAPLFDSFDNIKIVSLKKVPK